MRIDHHVLLVVCTSELIERSKTIGLIYLKGMDRYVSSFLLIGGIYNTGVESSGVGGLVGLNNYLID